jgi:Fe2+ or Zn2+ uptake regulation protein
LTEYGLSITIDKNSQLVEKNLLSKGKGRLRQLFHNRGFKCTPQRLAVLSVLEGSLTHLSIAEIHKRVKRILPGTGLATVYRALETLVDLRLVVRVHLEDGCHSYAIAPNGHQHPIVCIECSRVAEFAECPLEDISRKLSKETGFEIQDHFLQLFGKCQKCQSEVREREL